VLCKSGKCLLRKDEYPLEIKGLWQFYHSDVGQYRRYGRCA
jgi:hypothetical protein